MKRSFRYVAIVGAAATLIGFAAAPQAGAASTTNATCEVKTPVNLSPGITVTPSKGTFLGTGGKLICAAGSTFSGRPVTTSTSLVLSGAYGTTGSGDTCAAGSGTGKFVAKYLYKGVTYSASGTFTFVRAGVALAAKGTVAGATLGGVLSFQPPTGQNCATTPVTTATVDGFVHVQ